MADGTLVLNYSFLGQRMNNVLVFSNVQDDPVQMQAQADAIRGSWSSLMAPISNVQLTLESITFVFNGDLPIYSIEVPFTLGPVAGSNPGQVIPTQAALLVTTVHSGGKPNRGRLYLPGMVEGSLDAQGRFDASTRADAHDWVESLADGVGAAGSIIFLRIARRSPQGVIEISSPVNLIIPREVPAIQRRRRIGQGQ